MFTLFISNNGLKTSPDLVLGVLVIFSGFKLQLTSPKAAQNKFINSFSVFLCVTLTNASF